MLQPRLDRARLGRKVRRRSLRPRARLALLSALIGLGGLGLFASSAAASNQYYCGSLVPPYTACSNSVSAYVTSNSYNEAYYSGSGYISVCDKVTGFSYGLVQRYCNPASCNCNEADGGTISWDNFDQQYFYVGNNSPYSHTIHGYMAWNFGNP